MSHINAMPYRNIRCCIVADMQPHELIRELVHRAGGELRVAKAMHNAAFQGTLHKLCHGNVRSPKRETAERIAAHFDLPVDALYDAAVATRIYAERFGGPAVTQPPALYRVRAPAPPAAPVPPPLSAGAETLGRLYDSMSEEEQHRLRLLLWVVRPAINPTNFPPPGADHVDEPDSGMSNLTPPDKQ